MVEKGFFPERSFRTNKAHDAEAIGCIEGIRVADQIPWFGDAGGVNGILSVRGVRTFRTTVSRSGLERDDEYEKVGAICADLLFEHIRNEVRRISESAGHPLSQASSAAKWLRRDLRAFADSKPCIDALDELTIGLPAIVIEHDSRKMISRRELRNLKEFWTVESRLVDSLGTISRDLGRELGLGEFLRTLAPDLKQFRYSPILPDAHLFREAITVSHRPVRVEFSMEHQQTAIGWGLRASGEGLDEINLPELLEPKALRHLIQLMREASREDEIYPHHRDADPEERILIEAALIVGDNARVSVVNCRLGTILMTASEPHRMWTALRSAVIAASKADLPAREILAAFSVAGLFAWHVEGYRVPAARWKEALGAARDLLRDLKFKYTLVDDLRDIVPEDARFNASSYWRDWERRGGHGM